MQPLPPTRTGRLSPDEVLGLWREYHDSGDVGARDRLVLTFAPLVKYIVYKKVREIPARCDVDDFVSCGLEALLHSIDRYDPARGATLEQFAWTRIHGAVLDELRRNDWAPRSLRRWERDIARARDQFFGLHGRRPERSELAEALGIPIGELRAKEDAIAASDVTSLNTLVLGDDEMKLERIDTLASEEPASNPEHCSEVSAAKRRLRSAFERLSRREREVAIMLYVKNLTLREVGEVLGVSESRACQIHGQLKRSLRDALSADEALFAEIAA